MHDHASDGLSHPHIFLGAQHAANERRTFAVVGLTLAMMICEDRRWPPFRLDGPDR